MKEIAVPGLDGEFLYADYKEPLVPFEGGYGYVGAVLIEKSTFKLLCNYCGKTFEHLGSHVAKAHGMSAARYKEEIGLLQKHALATERVRLGNTRTALRTRLGQDASANAERLKAARRQVKRRVPAGNQTVEWQNKTGRCYAQVIEVGRTIARENGGRITFPALRRHGINEYVIRRFFGDLDGLRRKVGVSPGRPWRYSSTDLLDVLRNLARDIGRTPSASDIRHHGLPPVRTYVNHFGSWSEACRRAGLEPNLPIPTGNLEVRALVAYATLGNVRDVAALLHVDTRRVTAIFERYGAPFVTSSVGSGRDSSLRKEWAAEMARRLAGMDDIAA